MRQLLVLAMFALGGCVYCEQQSTCHVTSMPMVNTTATVPLSLPGLP
jgi:hypothetical protein